jgi:hypothetical protein
MARGALALASALDGMTPPSSARASRLEHNAAKAIAEAAKAGVRVGNGMTVGPVAEALEGFW